LSAPLSLLASSSLLLLLLSSLEELLVPAVGWHGGAQHV
jgi:hypothetical protein